MLAKLHFLWLLGILLPTTLLSQNSDSSNDRAFKPQSLNYAIGSSRYFLGSIEDGLYEAPILQISQSLEYRIGKKLFVGFKIGNTQTTFKLAHSEDSISPNSSCTIIPTKQYQVRDFGLVLGYNFNISAQQILSLGLGIDMGFFSSKTAAISEGLFTCDSLIFGGPDRRLSSSPFLQNPQTLSVSLEYHHLIYKGIYGFAKADGFYRWEKDNYGFTKASFRYSGAIGLSYRF